MKTKYLGLLFGLSLLFVSCGNNAKEDISNDEKNIEKEDEKGSYTVTWRNYDGNILEIDSEVLKDTFPSYDGDIPVRKSTEDYTYTFKGWEPTLKAVTSDITYTATFDSFELPKTVKYTITFDLNGGSSNYYAQTSKEFKISHLDKNDFFFDVKKENYRFAGWMCNGIQVFDSEGNIVNNIELRENLTFVAMFEEQVFLDITTKLYNPNNNTLVSLFKELDSSIGKVTTSKYYDWNTQVNLSIELMPGYTFIGWYSENTLLSTSSLYNFSMWDEDMSIEVCIKYTHFNLEIKTDNSNFGTIKIQDEKKYTNSYQVKKYYSEKITVSAFTKTDVAFLGWFDENNNLVSTNAVFSFNMVDRNYVLRAVWNLFTVNYNLDGGTNNLNNINSYSTNTKDVELYEPTKEGYTFVGWYYEGILVSEINVHWCKNVTLDAKWTYYTLSTSTNNIDGGSYSSFEETKITAGKEVTLVAEAKPLYTFAGWYEGETLLSYSNKFTFLMPKKSINYIAKYILKEELLDILSPFIFSTTDNKITITGIKDKTIAELIIPQNIFHIQKNAFYGCDNLKKVTTHVCFDNFSELFGGDENFPPNLKELNITGINSIKPNSISGKSLEYITISDSITKIDNSAFSSLKLKELTLPLCFESFSSLFAAPKANVISEIDRVVITSGEVIKDSMFSYSSPYGVTFKGISLPESITIIENNAFRSSSITNIFIPKNVQSIDPTAFGNCYNLSSIMVDSKNNIYDSRDNCNSIIETASNTLVLGCKDSSIPYGIKKIGDYAFADCKYLNSLTIPDSVIEIGTSAFKNCISLPQISIPNSVNSIGGGAFSGCTMLKSFTFPNSITIVNGGVLYDCTSIENISLPSGIKNIVGYAFYNCKRAKIDLPVNITNIGDYAFYNCEKANLVLPNSVSFIGDYAFNNCLFKDYSVTLGSNIQSIGKSAFAHAKINTLNISSTLLSRINSSTFLLDSNDYSYRGPVSKVNVTLDNNTLGYGFGGIKSITSVNLPEGLTAVGGFRNCSYLKTINIPEGVTRIEDYAFYGCSSLDDVILPSSLEYIGESAFYGCRSLYSIVIPSGVKSIGNNAFYNCTFLSSVSLNYGLERIGEYAFNNCTSLTKLNIPNSVNQLGQGCLNKLSSLELLSIPLCFSSFGFLSPDSLLVVKNLIINSGYHLKKGVFGGLQQNSIYEIELANSFLTIDDEVFKNYDAKNFYENLSKLTLPSCFNNFKQLFYQKNVFPSLQTVILNGGSVIQKECFRECKTLKKVELPISLIEIGEDAFLDCNLSGTITIPEKVTKIGKRAFSGCYKITEVNFISETGISVIENRTFAGCFALKHINLPKSITSIGELAFSQCVSLESINIPNDVTSIGKSAFASCSSLVNIELPNGLTFLGKSAFSDCSSLESANIPNGIAEICENTFQNCKSLKAITIPENINIIGSYAFSGCKSLIEITVPNSVTVINEFAFSECSSLERCELPSNLTSKPLNILRGCKSLQSISLPSTCFEIFDDLFVHYQSAYDTRSGFSLCPKLTYININGGTTISERAFDFSGSSCSSFGIRISSSIKVVGNDAFSGGRTSDTLTLYYGGNINEFKQIDGISSCCHRNNIKTYCLDGIYTFSASIL